MEEKDYYLHVNYQFHGEGFNGEGDIPILLKGEVRPKITQKRIEEIREFIRKWLLDEKAWNASGVVIRFWQWYDD